MDFDLSAVEAADWQTLVDEELKDRDIGLRYGVLGTVLRAAGPCLQGPGSLTLALTLKQMREALIPPMPIAPMHPNQPQAVALDKVLAIDDCCFWISGWLHDADGFAARLTAVSPEGVRAEMLETAFRFAPAPTSRMSTLVRST